MRSLLSLRVRVAEGGLSVNQKARTRTIAWPEISAVEEIHLYEPMVSRGVGKHVLPRVMSQSYVIKIKDQEPFSFDVNTIRGHVMLAQMIKKETDRRNIVWELTESRA